MGENIKVTIKDGSNKIKLSILDNKIHINSAETNDKELDMTALNQLINHVGTILQKETEEQKETSVNEEVNDIKTDTEIFEEVQGNNSNEQEEYERRKENAFDKLSDDVTRALFKAGWKDVTWTSEDQCLKASLNDKIMTDIYFITKDDKVKFIIKSNTGTNNTDSSFKVGKEFKARTGFEVKLSSMNNILQMEIDISVSLEDEPFPNLLSFFNTLLEMVEKEKELLMGEELEDFEIKKTNKPSDYRPYRPDRRPSGIFPYDGGMVCYYGCPNSKKVSKLQTQKHKKN